MAHTIRTAAVRVNRARDAAQSAAGSNDAFGEGLTLTGRLNNLVMCNVVPGVATPFGQIGPVNWWDRTVSISDMSFDNFEMNQAPVALGPGEYTFDVVEFTDLLIAGMPQRIRYQVRAIILPEHGTFDRNNAENRSRPVVLKPTLLVEGGGAGLGSHREGITKPEHGSAGDQYPFTYCDLWREAPSGDSLCGSPSFPARPLCSMAAAPEYVMTRLTGQGPRGRHGPPAGTQVGEQPAGAG